jgi:hypothetical protein
MFCVVQHIDAQDASVVTVSPKKKKVLVSQKAAMLSAVFPGMGQIYNKKYWKLPIVYAGFVGVGYGVAYNTTRHNKYIKAYQDFTDEIPETTSYTNYVYSNWLPENYDPVLHPDTYRPANAETIKDMLKTRIDYFRKNRDLSFIGIGAWYFLSILDANVDASMFDYDIDKNLNLTITPLPISVGTFMTTGINFNLTVNF